MIISTLSNLFIIIVLSGYSSFVKKLFSIDGDTKNIHLLLGIFFIMILSLLLNFFFPLKVFLLPVCTIGIILFIYEKLKNKIKINYFIHFLVLFFLSFITYKHGDNIDSPMYHLQIIKWLSNEKIVFGLSNLEIRFSINSMWFNILSILQFKYEKFNNIYFLNFIPFSIIITECFTKFEAQKKFSLLFLNFFIIFLIFFSFLHPFRNGIILNHLHNTEVDTVGMIFFTLSIYLFLKFWEKQTGEKFILLLVASLITLFVKISYVTVIFLPTLAFLFFFKKLDRNNIIFSLIITSLSSIFWAIKSFILSGCIIFPVSKTCFNTIWSPGVDEINLYSKIIKSYARDTRERQRYHDFDHTIDSFSWFKPWFLDNVSNALLQISIGVVVISISLIFILYLTKLLSGFNKILLKKYFIIVIFFFISWLFWFQAPEIRFGWAVIIATPCFIFSILIFHFKKKLYYLLNPYLITLFMMAILLYDNVNNLSYSNLLNPYTKQFNYSKIKKIGKFNGYQFYNSKDWKCYDFKEICVNSIKDKYHLKEYKSYKVIRTNF